LITHFKWTKSNNSCNLLVKGKRKPIPDFVKFYHGQLPVREHHRKMQDIVWTWQTRANHPKQIISLYVTIIIPLLSISVKLNHPFSLCPWQNKRGFQKATILSKRLIRVELSRIFEGNNYKKK